ncbi:hypothetical protein H1P_5500003 [Hyella patelloides LEGE 07179]|uniref:Uncharacterized protein n=1 Tax=Hyella patelloides LEGE 07179 TaxID=945734 RepID=A0A563W0A6_9CYAN|nr:hypothetical protein [Hyella patelloides]VEP17121.1 hypothetical protein H1P_5500003 [Hyella patelloides LEGE 07179]
MISKNKLKKSEDVNLPFESSACIVRQSDKILTSLDPKSDDFNFELWAKEVRQQMLNALQERASSS